MEILSAQFSFDSTLNDLLVGCLIEVRCSSTLWLLNLKENIAKVEQGKARIKLSEKEYITRKSRPHLTHEKTFLVSLVRGSNDGSDGFSSLGN